MALHEYSALSTQHAHLHSARTRLAVNCAYYVSRNLDVWMLVQPTQDASSKLNVVAKFDSASASQPLHIHLSEDTLSVRVAFSDDANARKFKVRHPLHSRQCAVL